MKADWLKKWCRPSPRGQSDEWFVDPLLLLVCAVNVCSVCSCWLSLSSRSSYASAIGFNQLQKVIRFFQSMWRLTMYCCHCIRSEVGIFFFVCCKFVVDSRSAVCTKCCRLRIIPSMNGVFLMFDSGWPLIGGWWSKSTHWQLLLLFQTFFRVLAGCHCRIARCSRNDEWRLLLFLLLILVDTGSSGSGWMACSRSWSGSDFSNQTTVEVPQCRVQCSSLAKCSSKVQMSGHMVFHSDLLCHP